MAPQNSDAQGLSTRRMRYITAHRPGVLGYLPRGYDYHLAGRAARRWCRQLAQQGACLPGRALHRQPTLASSSATAGGNHPGLCSGTGTESKRSMHGNNRRGSRLNSAVLRPPELCLTNQGRPHQQKAGRVCECTWHPASISSGEGKGSKSTRRPHQRRLSPWLAAFTENPCCSNRSILAGLCATAAIMRGSASGPKSRWCGKGVGLKGNEIADHIGRVRVIQQNACTRCANWPACSARQPAVQWRSEPITGSDQWCLRYAPPARPRFSHAFCCEWFRGKQQMPRQAWLLGHSSPARQTSGLNSDGPAGAWAHDFAIKRLVAQITFRTSFEERVPALDRCAGKTPLRVNSETRVCARSGKDSSVSTGASSSSAEHYLGVHAARSAGKRVAGDGIELWPFQLGVDGHCQPRVLVRAVVR